MIELEYGRYTPPPPTFVPTFINPPKPAITAADHTYELLALGSRIADLLERLVIALEQKQP